MSSTSVGCLSTPTGIVWVQTVIIEVTFILPPILYHLFIHPFTHSQHNYGVFATTQALCWGYGPIGQHSKPGLCFHGDYARAPGVTPKYDSAIPSPVSLGRPSSFRLHLPFLQWFAMACETLLITTPGEPRWLLDTGPPRMQGIVYQTSLQPPWWPCDMILAEETEAAYSELT